MKACLERNHSGSFSCGMASIVVYHYFVTNIEYVTVIGCGIKGIYARFNENLTNPSKFRSDIPDQLAKLLLELVAYERKKRSKIGGFDKLEARFKAIYQDLFYQAYLHREP